MEVIHSKCRENLKLHLIFGIEEMSGRKNLVDEAEFLQVSALKIASGEFFNAHMHIFKDVKFQETIAQESWVVMLGLIEVTYYDLDGAILAVKELKAGDCSITLQGGHRYEAKLDSLVYEFKSGPYEGQSRDKIMIN